jgi:hypothetical protein
VIETHGGMHVAVNTAGGGRSKRIIGRDGPLPLEEFRSRYYRQITSSFFKDAVGVGMLDKVGLGNVTFETDYPHQDGTWPRSRKRQRSSSATWTPMPSP